LEVGTEILNIICLCSQAPRVEGVHGYAWKASRVIILAGELLASHSGRFTPKDQPVPIGKKPGRFRNQPGRGDEVWSPSHTRNWTIVFQPIVGNFSLWSVSAHFHMNYALWSVKEKLYIHNGRHTHTFVYTKCVYTTIVNTFVISHSLLVYQLPSSNQKYCIYFIRYYSILFRYRHNILQYPKLNGTKVSIFAIWNRRVLKMVSKWRQNTWYFHQFSYK